MTGLQETFYIMAIVFMAINFIILLAILSAVFVIRAKINQIHDNIEEKLNMVSNLAEKGSELGAIAGGQVLKQAKKALSKRRK